MDFLAGIIKRICWGPTVEALSKEQMQHLSDFFLEDFSDIEVREGGLFPRIFPYYAFIVFERVINVKHGCLDMMRFPHIQAEEFAHVVQWRRYGRFKFPLMYLWAHFSNGKGYDGNPYELAAKEIAREFVMVSGG